jgi:hypothetical protein
MAMSENPPSNIEELGGIEGIGSRAIRSWGRALLRLVERPRRAPDRVRPAKPPAPEADERRRLRRLLAARDERAESLGIQGGLLCPRGVAEAVASHRPACRSVNDLAIAGLEGWRLEELADVFLDAIEGE